MHEEGEFPTGTKLLVWAVSGVIGGIIGTALFWSVLFFVVAG